MDQECTIFDLIIEDRITQMARMGDCAYAKTKGKSKERNRRFDD